ncbi:MAG: hypothetical protein P8174_06890 [Gemmatimonadota bacterium]|jgi:hypothetical protein
MALARRTVLTWLMVAGIPASGVAAQAVPGNAGSARQLQTTFPVARNALYLELAGNGGPVSLNYERAMTEALRIRVGCAKWGGGHSVSSAPRSYTVFPVMVQYVASVRGRNHLEMGAGLLAGTVQGKTPEHGIFDVEAMIGYRRQSAGGGFVLRVGLAAELTVLGVYPDATGLVVPGVSLGWAF